MINDEVLRKIKSVMVKHKFLKNQDLGVVGGEESFEYDFCLFSDKAYPDKYFVVSRENIWKNTSLDNVKLNAYVFDGNGNEIDFDTSLINLNKIIKESEKICEIA